jgi:ABC-2 type transport system ATP-binding protein
VLGEARGGRFECCEEAIVPTESRRLVEVENLSKRYGRTLALDEISLDIEVGERYAILGPNGAGKTTLIHVLCTILTADSGSARVDGFDVHRQARRVRSRIGVVFQETSLDTRLTVHENLDFHGRIYGVPARLRRSRIHELLELVELERWRGHLVRSLSKGMQRRLEVARALVHDAKLLVLDEPTVGLDAQTRARMWDYLRQLQRIRNVTLLVTTHYIEEVESCDRVCIVDHGRVLSIGSPGDLKARHGHVLVRVVPRDDATAEQLLTKHDDSYRDGDALLIPVAREADSERLLIQYGGQLRAFSIERPSLESVFLDLTGRTIRDHAAGSTDHMLAAPRSGGEPIR